jgi:hypothetical protein
VARTTLPRSVGNREERPASSGQKAEGEAKVQRKAEVRRVHNYVEMMDALKVRNANLLCSNTVVVTTRWETFDSGVGSLNTPPSSTSTKITQDWESFD